MTFAGNEQMNKRNVARVTGVVVHRIRALVLVSRASERWSRFYMVNVVLPSEHR